VITRCLSSRVLTHPSHVCRLAEVPWISIMIGVGLSRRPWSRRCTCMPRSGMNMDGGGAHRAVSVERGQFGAQFNAIMPQSATPTMTTMTEMTDMPVIIHSWMTRGSV
jgi:hypothetical protein